MRTPGRDHLTKPGESPLLGIMPLPAPVEVGRASYFLTRDSYKLLSRVCPHQGDTVEDEGGAQFVCRNHGYQYDKDGGKRLSAAGLRMKSYVVNIKEGRLIALLPDAKTGNSALTGQTVQQIADAQGKHVIDALLDIPAAASVQRPSLWSRPRACPLPPCSWTRAHSTRRTHIISACSTEG